MNKNVANPRYMDGVSLQLKGRSYRVLHFLYSSDKREFYQVELQGSAFPEILTLQVGARDLSGEDLELLNNSLEREADILSVQKKNLMIFPLREFESVPLEGGIRIAHLVTEGLNPAKFSSLDKFLTQCGKLNAHSARHIVRDFIHCFVAVLESPIPAVPMRLSPRHFFIGEGGAIRLTSEALVRMENAAGVLDREVAGEDFNWYPPEFKSGVLNESTVIFVGGVLFYYLLTHRYPYQLKDRADFEAFLLTPPEQLKIDRASNFNGSVDAELDAILFRMLSPRISENVMDTLRYSHIEWFLDDLRCWETGRPRDFLQRIRQQYENIRAISEPEKNLRLVGPKNYGVGSFARGLNPRRAYRVEEVQGATEVLPGVEVHQGLAPEVYEGLKRLRRSGRAPSSLMFWELNLGALFVLLGLAVPLLILFYRR